MARGTARALWLVLVACGLFRPAAAQSLICDACQAMASVVLRRLQQLPPSAGAGSADRLAAAADQELRAAEAPRELGWAASRLGLPPERVAERCAVFLKADRPQLRRLLSGGEVPSWEQVSDELCLKRLRCPPGGAWPSAAPWEEQGEPRTSPAAASPVSPEAAAEAAPRRAARATPGGRTAPGRPRSTYETMLEDYSGRPSAQGGPEEGPAQGSARGTPRRGKAAVERAEAAEVAEEQDLSCASGSGDACRASPPAVAAAAGTVAGARSDGAAAAAAQEAAGAEDEPEDPLNPRCKPRRDTYRDLAGVRIVAVVFSGRRDRLKILMRYLRRDLRAHGGVLDSVILALWEYTPRDLTFMEKLVAESNGTYEIRDFSRQHWGNPREGADPSTNNMVRLYQSLDEPETIYVKIDDDVVYVAPHAIAALARERLRGRYPLVVTAVTTMTITTRVTTMTILVLGLSTIYGSTHELEAAASWCRRTS